MLSSKYSISMPACWSISSDSFRTWYFFSQTTFLIQQLMISMVHVLHGVILQYSVAHSTAMPNFAAWQIAFCSAWIVLTQWLVTLPSSWVICLNWCPTSSQWGSPAGDHTYHVHNICLFLAITHQLLSLSQVALWATVFATSIKYSSRVGRMYFFSISIRIKNKNAAILFYNFWNQWG